MRKSLDITEKLRQDGYCLLSNFLSETSEKDGFIKEVDSIISNSKDDSYEFGKAERIGSLESNSDKRPFIFQAFNKDILRQVKSEWLGTNPGFTEIFVTYEFTDDRGLARNGYLHFDRLYTLKFFFYASDVLDEADGPLTLVPGSHNIGKKLRIQEKDNPYRNKKNRIKIDHPKLYNDIKDKMVPIFGPAGTLIIFDTDIFHMGGTVSSGHTRKVCRLHMR